MAGDWIKIEHSLPEKPEVFRLAEILGIEPDTVVGKLVRFWSWCDQQSINGESLGVSPSTIDHVTRLPGFSDALRKVDWLLARSGSLAVPHFDRHNGQTAKARAVTNRRVAGHREEKKRDKPPDVTADALQKPLPEKRREESTERERESGAQSADSDSVFLQAPCTEEEAWAYAQTVESSQGLKWIRPAITVWWDKREKNSWRTFNGRPVTNGNWQADLRDSAGWAHEEARKAALAMSKASDPLKTAMKPGKFDKPEVNAADVDKFCRDLKKSQARQAAADAELAAKAAAAPVDLSEISAFRRKLTTESTADGALILTEATV